MGHRSDNLDPWRFLLLGSAGLVISYTLAPFELYFETIPARLAEARSWAAAEGGIKIIAHFLAFAFLGFCFGKLFTKPKPALWIVSTFVLSLEITQLLVPERHARLTDFLLNSMAAFAGYYLGRKSLRTSVSPLNSSTLLKLSLAFTASVWLIASIYPAFALSLKSWRLDSRIVIGNELDDSEPWNGIVTHVLIAPGENQSGNWAPKIPWLTYDLRDASGLAIEAAGSFGSPELRLILPQDVSTHGFRSLSNSALVSAGTAERLTDAIQKAGSFKIKSRLEETQPSTNSAGRLSSLSSTVGARNFMLGREGEDIVFRVRNGVMEENGRRNILIARSALTSNPKSLIASYDHGVAAIYNEFELLACTDLRLPTVLLRLGTSSGAGFAAGSLLGVFVGFPLYCLLPVRGTFQANLCALAGTTIVSLVPFLITWRFLGGPLNLSFIGISLVAIGLAYLVAHFYCLQNVNALRQSGPSRSHPPL
jgi:hypothetical protein